jgi:hypothetical protein
MSVALFPKRYEPIMRTALPGYLYEVFRNGVNMMHPYCPVCQQRIYGKFHIGHIISVAHGGNNNCENLVAMHPRCNCKMGSNDLSFLIKNNPEHIRKETLIFKRRDDGFTREYL